MKDLLKTNCFDIHEINYVAVNDKLNEIPLEVISLSKNLSKLKERMPF